MVLYESILYDVAVGSAVHVYFTLKYLQEASSVTGVTTGEFAE
jgi:hypothetical protein